MTARTPITFLCWRWKPTAGYRSTYKPETVHALRAMVARHYAAPHRFLCVTDDTAGLEGIETFPLWPDGANLRNPHGGHNPSCYRRLKAFSADAREWFGERIVSLDLDTVIVRDIQPLFDRAEDFVIWGESDFPRTQWFNGSLWYLRAGTRTQVWTQFDPKHSPKIAAAAGARGSDQGWISYILGPKEATWGRRDGVYSFRKHILPTGGHLPSDARIVNFHGNVDPWSQSAQRLHWVREHYGVAA